MQLNDTSQNGTLFSNHLLKNVNTLRVLSKKSLPIKNVYTVRIKTLYFLKEKKRKKRKIIIIIEKSVEITF